MLEKKIDKLIDNITPALLNCGVNVPTDYNDLYKIISNAIEVTKATYNLHVKYNNVHYSINDYIVVFGTYCVEGKIPMHIMIDNMPLVRSIVQEIIK